MGTGTGVPRAPRVAGSHSRVHTVHSLLVWASGNSHLTSSILWPQFSGSWATAFAQASPFSPLSFPSHLPRAVDRTWGLEFDAQCSNPSLAGS